MDSIFTLFQDAFYSVRNIGFSDILDIFIVALIFYKLFMVVQSTSTARILKALIVLLVATWLTGVLELHMLNFLLTRILELGAIALVIMFQPELRRMLDRFGGKSVRELVGGKTAPKSGVEDAIRATVAACEIMSRERTGVLMAFEREVLLDEYFKSGTIVDAKVSEQLLRNLFFPNASLHDGAVIVRKDRVIAAGCVMPLTENTHLSADLGTRHRAGVGTSEASDAVVVIVSEETGTISVAIGGMLKRHLAPQMLEKLLMRELVPMEDTQKSVFDRMKDSLTKRDKTNAK